MSEEIKRERSRNCPNIALSDAFGLAKKLYEKAGKAKIKAEVAVNALGYAGLNGAALTTLGALNQYGLVDREKGGIVAVSPQAIRLIHPLNAEQHIQTLRELALKPQVFMELYEGGFQNGTDDLIANHLIQNGFTPEKAKKSSLVFKANIELANLKADGIKLHSDAKKDDAGKVIEKPPVELTGTSSLKANLTVKNMLAQYSIPIGASEATITFTGEKLSVEDFDALADYVAIFKKQFERKQKAESSNPIPPPKPPKPAFPEPPFVAQWKGQNFDKMVKIIGQPWFEKGEWIYQADGGALVPAKELFPKLGK